MGHTLKKVTSEFANSNFGEKTSKINRKNHFKISAQLPAIVKQRRSAKGIILLLLLFCFSEKCCIVEYKEGKILWKCQAESGESCFELVASLNVHQRKIIYH